jgi:hypothetical protein
MRIFLPDFLNGQTLISDILYMGVFSFQHVKTDSAWCGYYADANLVRFNIPPDAKFFVILCACIILRSCHLRLTLGRAPLRINIIGSQRRAQVRPPSSIFEQYESTTGEPEFFAQ